MYFPKGLMLVGASLLLLASCNPSPSDNPSAPPGAAEEPLTDGKTLRKLELFKSHSHDLLKALEVCNQALTALSLKFLEQVDEDNLQRVRDQQHNCWQIYQAARALRGFNDDQQKELDRFHSNLGSKLQHPGFIDGVTAYPSSGIVNDVSLPLNQQSLRQQHGLTHESDVAIGFDVIAFLLWGEHHYDKESPARQADQFREQKRWQDGRTDLAISQHPQNRRRKLLQLTLDMAQRDIQQLQKQWASAEVPIANQAAQAWQIKQLKSLKVSLAQQPDNEHLLNHLWLWYQKGALPGISQPQPDQTIQSLDQLLALLETALESGSHTEKTGL